MAPTPFLLGERSDGVVARRDGSNSSGGSNFPQTGSYNWVDLVKVMVTAPLGIFQRLSQAGIDPATVVVTEALGTTITWGAEGQDRFNEALDSLRHAGIFSNQMLFIGFYVEHATYIMSRTEEGCKTMAVCASLAQCYEVEYVAKVMVEWVGKLVSRNETSTPSYQQWLAVAKCCANILSRSQFATLVERFMRLDEHTRIAGNVGARASRPEKNARRKPSRGITKPQDLATALVGLCKVSKQDIQHITLIGGADAAFLAAFAHFFLDLWVIIRRADQESEVLLRICPQDKIPHLEVRLETRARKSATDEHKTTKAVEMIKEVYYLKDETDLIRKEFNPASTAMVSGRVNWERALQDTFGADFIALMNCAHGGGNRLGQAIGCAARIYAAIVEADRSVPVEWLGYCRLYFEQSSGIEYARFAGQRFPELQTIEGDMTSFARLSSFEEASERWNSALDALSTICRCRDCGTDDNVNQTRVFCLVGLTETIVRMIRSLAGIHSDILPSRGGLELMYVDHMKRMRGMRSGKATWGSDWGKRLTANRIVEHIFTEDGEPTTLAIAEVIFGGGRYKNDRQIMEGRQRPRIVEGQRISAVEDQGLCYFLGVLKDPHQDFCSLARVHVIQGIIRLNKERYEYVCDGPNHKFVGRPRLNARDKVQIENVNNKLIRAIESSSGGKLELIAQEGTSGSTKRGIVAEYGVKIGRSLNQNHQAIGPCACLDGFAQSMGLAHCNNDSHSYPLKEDLDSLIRAAQANLASGKAYSLFEYSGSKVYLTIPDVPISMLVAGSRVDSIVVRDECISCCVQNAAVERGWEDFAIIQMNTVQSIRIPVYQKRGPVPIQDRQGKRETEPVCYDNENSEGSEE